MGGGSALNSGENGKTNPTEGGNGGASTGGGGGGGGNSDTQRQGGSGGSGIVIVRYQVSVSQSGTAKATGGSISYYGGKTIHTFTGSGTFAKPANWDAGTDEVEYVVVVEAAVVVAYDQNCWWWWRCWRLSFGNNNNFSSITNKIQLVQVVDPNVFK